jgi:hypothetical protein
MSGKDERVTDDEQPGPDEEELLAAFDRLRPQGSLRWGFDDAMRRVANTDGQAAAGAAPWEGLPTDLWERGRTARIGRRFVGDVAGVLAGLLAADARRVADAAVAGVNAANWDALRYLAARVELLEARVDPVGLEVADLSVPAPDTGEWAEAVGTWLHPGDSESTIFVGELGDGALLDALREAGRRVRGVDPRGASIWEAFARAGREGQPDSADRPAPELVFGEVAGRLATMPDGSAGGVVLSGCVDRLDLVGKVGLVHQAVRVTEAGGAVVLLATDQSAWDRSLPLPARDLLPGRPLHPETWLLLLRRAGAADPVWHRPVQGTVHAVVARVER